MKSSKSLMEDDWDFLLVLDACRYDYFEKVHEDYFEGELEKLVSSGTETSEWLRNTFPDEYEDVVYVSANPRINSKVEVKGFDASEHFHEVIDVWDWGWDKDLGTVLPRTVNEAIFEAKENYPEKRIIAHYMQPHAPYLSVGPLDVSGNKKTGQVRSKRKSLWRNIGSKLTRTIGQKRLWKLREMLGIRPVSPMYSVFRELGEEGIKVAYENNLREVLGGISRICEKLAGDIVITSDHGELLGEGGNFGHYEDFRKRALFEVPWFRVEGSRNDEEKSTRSEK